MGAFTNSRALASARHIAGPQPTSARTEPVWIRATLITITFAFLGVFILWPLLTVFHEGFSKGFDFYIETFKDPITIKSIELTLLTAAIAVPLNTIFGLAAAWALTRFKFRGRQLLIALIDLPLWVSPVIGGLIYILLFGRQGTLGPWLMDHNIQIVFALPGIVLATTFVTFPFVARSLIPLMEAQGHAEEEAALTLGANGWQVFFRITLPKVKWGLLYGIILCNARAMGEFGAVSVVSGHIRGKTNTMPLHIEILYNEYQFAAAFAVASLLSLLALITLFLKTYSESRTAQQLREAQELTIVSQ